MPTHPPDEIIHQLLRLRIMAAIYAGRRSLPLEFTDLKRIAQATDGNLGSHLSTLEKAGYVAIAKDFVGRKPRTRVAITPKGMSAFRGQLDSLRGVIEAAGLD